MAGENTVPERLINFRVYAENNDLLGIATVEMPEIAYMTDTVSGAGIAGEVESPIIGHIQSMSAKFSWRTVEKRAMMLAEQKAHLVEVRGSQQIHDASHGIYSSRPVRVTMKLVPKTVSLGSFEVGSTTDTETEFEVLYLKVYVNGEEMLEVDKYNYKFVVNGSDQLSGVRADLGLA